MYVCVHVCMCFTRHSPQVTEKDELVQAKESELAQAQQKLRQLRQQVIFIT